MRVCRRFTQQEQDRGLIMPHASNEDVPGLNGIGVLDPGALVHYLDTRTVQSGLKRIALVLLSRSMTVVED